MKTWKDIEEYTTAVKVVNGENVRVLGKAPSEAEILLAIAFRIIRSLQLDAKDSFPDYCPMCSHPSNKTSEGYQWYPRGYEELLIEEFINRYNEYQKKWMKDIGDKV